MLPHPDVCSRWNRLAAVAFAILWVAPLPKWRVYGGLVALCALIAGGDVLAIAEIASEGDEGKRFEVTVFGALAVGGALGYFANWIRRVVRDSAKFEEG